MGYFYWFTQGGIRALFNAEDFIDQSQPNLPIEGAPVHFIVTGFLSPYPSPGSHATEVVLWEEDAVTDIDGRARGSKLDILSTAPYPYGRVFAYSDCNVLEMGWVHG
jgi:hypothetical protein